MIDDPLKLNELTARLSADPQFAKDLLLEMAKEVTKEYLTIEEVAQRLSLDKRTVKNKMAAGIFMKGVHYFSPEGIGPRFNWSAIQAWLEGSPLKEHSGIPMRGGYSLNASTSEIWKNEDRH